MMVVRDDGSVKHRASGSLTTLGKGERENERAGEPSIGTGRFWGAQSERCGTGLRVLRVSERDKKNDRNDGEYGQARKGSWWMPRSYCTKKAVVSCDKPGGGAHIPRSPGSRMG
jgi:hypothetical protein